VIRPAGIAHFSSTAMSEIQSREMSETLSMPGDPGLSRNRGTVSKTPVAPLVTDVTPGGGVDSDASRGRLAGDGGPAGHRDGGVRRRRLGAGEAGRKRAALPPLLTPAPDLR